MTRLDGRAALVTGATGNLGHVVVRRYVEAGAHVAALARDAAKAADLRADLREFAVPADAPRVIVLEADPGDRSGMDAAVASVVARWGRIDAVANLAGVFSTGEPWDLDAIERAWDANVRTAVVATSACLAPMRARGYGRIVSVGSSGADRGGKDAAGYAMAKTALVRWTESLAAALKDEGITANVVKPSVIDHPENRRRMPKADPARWVTPDEMAALILFLSSAESSGITGAAIPIVGRV